MLKWTVHIVLERVPDCVELLDELAYLEPKLLPLDHQRCVLELSVLGPDYEYAAEYADARVLDVVIMSSARETADRMTGRAAGRSLARA